MRQIHWKALEPIMKQHQATHSVMISWSENTGHYCLTTRGSNRFYCQQAKEIGQQLENAFNMIYSE